MPNEKFFSYQEQFNSDESMMFALYQINTLSWVFIVLAHWNNKLWVDMSFHLDTLFWASQSLFLLLNFIVFGFNKRGLESMIYHTRGEHATDYTTYMVNISLNVHVFAYYKNLLMRFKGWNGIIKIPCYSLNLKMNSNIVLVYH